MRRRRTIIRYVVGAYPQHHLQESVTQSAQSIGHTLSQWAAQATRNTGLPQVQPTYAPPTHPRTLHHAIARSATAAAMDLGKCPQQMRRTRVVSQ